MDWKLTVLFRGGEMGGGGGGGGGGGATAPSLFPMPSCQSKATIVVISELNYLYLLGFVLKVMQT